MHHGNESLRGDSGSAGPARIEWAADEWRENIRALAHEEQEHRAEVRAALKARVDYELDLIERLWEGDSFSSEKGGTGAKDYLKARLGVLSLQFSGEKLVSWQRESARKTTVGGYQTSKEGEANQRVLKKEHLVTRLEKISGGRH